MLPNHHSQIAKCLHHRSNEQQKIFRKFYKYLNSHNSKIITFLHCFQKTNLFQNFCLAASREEENKFKHPSVSYNCYSRECALAFIAALFSPPDFLLSGGFKRGVFSQLRPRGGGGAEPVLPRSLLVEFNAGSGSKCPVQTSAFSGNSRNILNYFSFVTDDSI